MRRFAWRHRGPILTVLAALPALTPLLRPGLIRAMDAYVHAFRLAEYHRVLQTGALLPRWAPNFGYGYGDGVFNFYAPLIYALAEAFHVLGLDLILSLKAVWVVAVLLAALATYAWAREIFGRDRIAAAWLAAVAYVYFSYFLVNLYERGALAEALAMAVAPLAAWALHRLVVEQRLVYVPVVSLVLAALLLAHNIAAVMFAPALGGYVLYLLIRKCPPAPNSGGDGGRFPLSPSPQIGGTEGGRGQGGRRRATLLLAAAGLLFLALTAFYWLPAWAELPFVSAEHLTDAAFDPRTMLRPLTDLVQLTWFYDYARKNVGLLPLLLALVAVALLPWHKRAPRGLLATLAGLAAVQLFLMSDLARPLWDAVGLVSHVWPWRFLAGVGLCLTPLIGSLAMVNPVARCRPRIPREYTNRESRIRVFGPYSWMARGMSGILSCLPVLLVALILAGSALLALPGGHWRLTDAELSVAALHRQEYLSGHMGASISSEYVPAWVRWEPGEIPRRPLTSTERGIDPAATPPSVQVLQHTPFELRLATSGDVAGPIVLHAFYYPTQHATVDGQPVPVRPVGPLGLAAIDVPAGAHQVAFYHADTPVRLAGNVISLVALLVLAALVFWTTRWRGLIALLVPTVLAIAFLSIPSLIAVPPPAIQTFTADFGPSIRLVGYRLDASCLESTGEADLTLYWQARGPVTEAHSVALRRTLCVGWRGTDDTVWSHREGHPVHGTAPPTTWEVGEVIPDEWRLTLPPQAPPGDYRLVVAVLAPAGEPLNIVPIITQTVRRPAVSPVEPTFQYSRELVLGDETGQVAFVGFDLGTWAEAGPCGPAPVQPGQSLDVTLGWRARGIIRDDYSVALTLRDGRGHTHAQRDFPPVIELPPTTQWPQDKLVTRSYDLAVPRDLGPGAYELCMSLYDGLTGRRLLALRPATGVAEVPLARVKVPYPHQAAPSHPVDAQLDDRIALVGYDVTPEPLRVGANADEYLYLTLYWRCLAPIDTSYTVSAQVIGPDGVLWGQEDFEPVGGTYLTTDWGVGEVIPDTYRIAIWEGAPPGEYHFAVNMYDKAANGGATGAPLPSTGARVTFGALAAETQP